MRHIEWTSWSILTFRYLYSSFSIFGTVYWLIWTIKCHNLYTRRLQYLFKNVICTLSDIFNWTRCCIQSHKFCLFFELTTSRGFRVMSTYRVESITFVNADSDLSALCRRIVAGLVCIYSNQNFKTFKIPVCYASVSHRNCIFQSFLCVLQDWYWHMCLVSTSLKCDGGSKCLKQIWARSSPSASICNWS